MIRLKEFNFDSEELFSYLNYQAKQEFSSDVEKMVEQRLQFILARRHQKIVENEIRDFYEKGNLFSFIFSPFKSNFKIKILIERIRIQLIKRLKPFLVLGFIIFVIYSFFGQRIIDGLTPVNELSKKLYERNVYNFNGSICCDGRISTSQGRGACSWHQGVCKKFYKGQHKKTMKECISEAKELSWLD